MTRLNPTPLIAVEPGKESAEAPPIAMGFIDRAARKAVLANLRKVREGRMSVTDSHGRWQFGLETDDGPRANVVVHRPAFYRRVARAGSLGAAESFMDGDWSCDDLTALLRIFTRAAAAADAMDRGRARLSLALAGFWHRLRRNTRGGSRRNIADHYDLGNDFYALWLDETMTYSCGIFEHPSSTLAQASTAKLDRLCRKLDLKATDHVLEIGAGWGSFALHAAGHYGCRVTTTTISRRQHDLARQRIADAGLGGRVTLLLKDYRDLEGQYDKLVSIEMIEAVGHEFLGTYFRQCESLLKPHGAMAIQAITMNDRRYERYRRSADFIQRYIFPGSCCPSIAAITAAARGTDLKLVHLEDIGPHYARTLRLWRQNFLARLDRVRALGYPTRFLRMWEYYLCYCEAGFEERYIGDAQLVFTRPRSRLSCIVPPLPG
jgi:cyclopropane-fatty-acyl-phospholipid synthase